MSDKLHYHKQQFVEWYRNLQKLYETNKEVWNLMRCRNKQLTNMVDIMHNEFNMIYNRVQSGKTHCVIFDSKKCSEDTVIKALIGENMPTNLDSKREYYMKGDSNTNVSEIAMETSNEIWKIIVPSCKWTTLETLRLTISPDTYDEFLGSCEKRGYVIDSILIILNSVKDFYDDDIIRLLKHIRENYPTPLIILNDAPDNECNLIKHCDKCYNDTREQLCSFNLTDNRFIKLSARSTIQNSDSIEKLRFEMFKRILEEDVKMENVIDRFCKRNQIFMPSFDSIQKLLMEDKSNILQETEDYQCKLNNDKLVTFGIINQSKERTENIVKIKLKEMEMMKDVNKDILIDNISPIIYDQYSHLREDIKIQILNTMKSNNQEFENYISIMCVNEYLNPVEFEDKLKTNIDKVTDEIITEMQSGKVEKTPILSVFWPRTKALYDNTIGGFTGAFKTFVGQFKDDILNKHGDIEKTIKEIKVQYINCSLTDKPNEIQIVIKKLKLMIEAEKETMRMYINDYCENILKEIKAKHGYNVYPNDITKYISSEHSLNISTNIESILEKLSNDIVYNIEHISVDIALSQWLIGICELYRQKYVYKKGEFQHFTDINVFDLFNCLRSEEMYHIRSRDVQENTNVTENVGVRVRISKGANVGAIAGSVVPIVGTFVGAAFGGVIGAVAGTRHISRKETRVVTVHTKTIKWSVMTDKVNVTKKVLLTKADSIMETLLNNLEKFLDENNLNI